MVVCLARACVGHAVNRCGVRMRIISGDALMCIASVDEITMLGASRMLDQEHVAAARTL
jgi:hypothetical protein